ncbi:ATP-dependent helicase [Pilimelia columellifera]|uniref:ATP-dependent helicase n=1 Tax=Pilimelia columellifera TaxID=706574 RepID=UPI003CD06494
MSAEPSPASPTAAAPSGDAGGGRAGGYRLVRPVVVVPAPLAVDPDQRRVVEHTGRPMLVLGGPGTGKTTTLVEAVAARVAEGVDPERVLALTFGRRAATALRRRIEARVTRADGARPTGRAVREPMVRTFHAYAFGLLRNAAAQRGEPPPRLLTGPEQDLIIRELVAPFEDEPSLVRWPEQLRAAVGTRAFAGQLRDLLLRAAERGVSPAGLATLARRHGRPDWQSAAAFMEQYAEVLALRDATSRGAPAYDNAELVRAAAALLTADQELLAAERGRLAYVYVDELADTDPAQLDLLELVAGGGLPVVAFADPDSSIYSFRGADPAGARGFPDRFRAADGAPAPTITLSTSYRAGGDLLAATRRIAARLRGPGEHRRLREAAKLAAVTVTTFRTVGSEAAFAAHTLREAHLRDGVPWSQMAVLTRASSQLPTLERALHTAGVPTVTHADDLALHRQPAVAPLLLLLRCAVEPERLDEEAAVALLHSPFGGADPLAERRLRQGLRALALAAGDHRATGDLLVEALAEPGQLAATLRRWAEPGQRVAGLLDTARQAAARPGSTVEDVLWAVWDASGLAERWSAAATRPPRADEPAHVHQRRAMAADRDLDAVVVLFDTAARFVDRLPGARTEVFLDHVLGQQLPADTLAPSADRGEAVRLLSAHAAKGLEWDVVVIPGVQEGVWPDLRLRGSLLGAEQLVDAVAGREAAAGAAAVSARSALLDDERRLFYVACARARRRLVATAVASGAVGGADGEEQPSRFLHELGVAGHVDDEGAPQLPAAQLPRALTLPALVAELRSAAADPQAPEPRRRAAAAQLARLALAGVAGADPDQWWGLPQLTDDGPLFADDDAVRVTPSTMESVLRCSLRWLLERHGGRPADSSAQGLGNLVHAAAMLAEDAHVDRAALVDYVGARFDAIELAARWLADREHQRAETMVDKLLGWLAVNPRRLLAIEREFAVRLAADGDGPAVELTGRVDRLEVDDAGRLVVVDLKTGKTTSVTGADLSEHPQLGAYQAAVEAGAFAEGDVSGGAALVQLGTTAGSAREQVQPPVADADDPGWAQAMVRRTAATMAASTFAAVANKGCRTCPVRVCCPVSGHGRQVVEPPAGAGGATS